MKKKINIKLVDDNGTNAPLFKQYHTQYNPQIAQMWIELTDEDDDEINVELEYDPNIGSCYRQRSGWDYVKLPSAITRSWIEDLEEGEYDEFIVEFSESDSESRSQLQYEIDEENTLVCWEQDIASIFTLSEWFGESSVEQIKKFKESDLDPDSNQAVIYDDFEAEIAQIIEERE